MSNTIMNSVVDPSELPRAFHSPSKGEESSNVTASGMWAVMAAMLANFDAISKNESDGLLPLGEAENQMNLGYSNYWVAVMQGDENLRTAQIQAYTTTFNLHSTLASQSSSFYGGLTSAVQQTASDTSQTSALDVQMYEQGPLSQLQTIARGF